jgi:hypothetical protein
VSSLPDLLSFSPLPTSTSTWLDANREAMASAINSGVYRRAIATPVGSCQPAGVAVASWWRRRESNPRPRTCRKEHLRA